MSRNQLKCNFDAMVSDEAIFVLYIFVRLLILVLSSFPLSKDCRTDLASENTMMLFGIFVLSLKCFGMFCREASLASAFASKFDVVHRRSQIIPHLFGLDTVCENHRQHSLFL